MWLAIQHEIWPLERNIRKILNLPLNWTYFIFCIQYIPKLFEKLIGLWVNIINGQTYFILCTTSNARFFFRNGTDDHQIAFMPMKFNVYDSRKANIISTIQFKIHTWYFLTVILVAQEWDRCSVYWKLSIIGITEILLAVTSKQRQLNGRLKKVSAIIRAYNSCQ